MKGEAGVTVASHSSPERLMLYFAKIAAVALLTASSAQAVVIVGELYNTGVGVGGVALAAGNGQTDGNYTITAATHAGAAIGPAATYFNAAYAAENAGSRWIAFQGNIAAIPSVVGNPDVGFFDLTTSFDLTGFVPGTASITGRWGTDNQGEIFLNNISTGITLTQVNTANFRVLSAFAINSGFVSGLNTLTLRVTNNGGPTAGRFDNLVLSASVPEPASWAMLIAGFGLVGAAARRRRTALQRVTS